MDRKKVVISMSGGLDSTCLALYYLAKGYEVRAIGFYYGQRHSVELERLKKNVKYLSKKKGLPITLEIVNLKDVFSGSVCSMHKESGNDIPTGLYNEENMKSTVEPNRNVIFSSVVFAKALNWALKENDNVTISLGVHGGDHSIYPDCRPESVQAAQELFKISNWDSDKVNYESPFVNIDKAEVLKKGLDAMNILGFNEKERDKVLENTNSCYNPVHGKSCGKCGTCTERAYAFYKNNVFDPAPSVLSRIQLRALGSEVDARLKIEAFEKNHTDTHSENHSI